MLLTRQRLGVDNDVVVYHRCGFFCRCLTVNLVYEELYLMVTRREVLRKGEYLFHTTRSTGGYCLGMVDILRFFIVDAVADAH